LAFLELAFCFWDGDEAAPQMSDKDKGATLTIHPEKTKEKQIRL
jgi:hypothetical protein